VAAHIGCGGMLSDFIAIFLVSPLVKEF